MTTDVLRFEFGALTEFISPSGKHYLRGEIEGMKITLLPEPDREPAQGGVMRWSVWCSPKPGKARHVRAPAVPASEPLATRAQARATAKGRQEAAVQDILDRYGRIDGAGDPLPPSLAPEVVEQEVHEDLDLLHTPLDLHLRG